MFAEDALTIAEKEMGGVPENPARTSEIGGARWPGPSLPSQGMRFLRERCFNVYVILGYFVPHWPGVLYEFLHVKLGGPKPTRHRCSRPEALPPLPILF